MSRHLTSFAIGALGGIAGVLALGSGYAIRDLQRSLRRTLTPRRNTK